jgi:ATP/ADP translocase
VKSNGHRTYTPTPHKSVLFRVGVGITALAPATFLTILIDKLRPNLRPSAVFLIFVGAYVASYFVWGWIFFERAAELQKKIPISSKELQRRTKEFYKNLPR